MKSNSNITYPTYTNPAGAYIPISASLPRSTYFPPKYLTAADVKEMTDAGFNVCFLEYSGNNLINSLNNLGSEMKAILRTSAFQRYMYEGSIQHTTDSIKEEIRIYMESLLQNTSLADKIWGWYLADEPTLLKLNGNDPTTNDNGIEKNFSYNCDPDNPQYFTLQQRYNFILEVQEEEENQVAYPPIPYINLLPLDLKAPGSAASNTGTPNDYMNAFQENFKPAFWSYDEYPILEENYLLVNNYRDGGVAAENSGNVVVKNAEFYYDLYLYSQRAKNNSKPFWNYCMCTEYIQIDSDTSYYRPMAMEQYIRFQVFSSLAYGAQGISHWRFGTIQSDNGEYYLSAPLNFDCQKTPVWFFVKKVNEEIQRYKEVFLGTTVEKVVHLGTDYTADAPWCQGQNFIIPFSGNLGKLVSAEMVTDKYPRPPRNAGQTDLTQGVLMSLIKEERVINGLFKSKNHLIIVSHDPVNYQEISLTFKDNAQITELTPLKSVGIAPTGYVTTGTPIKRTLIPGGYLIYSWDTYSIKPIADEASNENDSLE